MVLVHELRILHPYTVEDFERGQTWGNLKTAERLEQPGQGSTMISSERFYDEVYGEGAYNRSITNVGEGRLPGWLVRMFPAEALALSEECWSIYPYCKTRVTVPMLQGLKCEVLSMHLQDKGTTENALSLPKDLLAKRTVEMVDLGAAKVDPKDYSPDRDPALVKSTLTGKGPLKPGWQEREGPIMCAYKVIVAEFRYPGVSGNVEKLLVNMMRNLFTLSHMTCFSTLDEWYPKSTEEVLDVMDARHLKGGGKVVEVRRQGLRPSVEALSPATPEALEPPLSCSESEASTLSVDDLADEDDHMDMFLDAEMDFHKDDEALALLLEPSPSVCPACVFQEKTTRLPPSVRCLSCSEFFCRPCFEQVHVTPKLQQHQSLPLKTSLSKSETLRSASLSVAGSVPMRFERLRAMKQTGALQAQPGSSASFTHDDHGSQSADGAEVFDSVQGEGSETGLEREEEEEGKELSWDQVKDPPLNIFAAPKGGNAVEVPRGEAANSEWMSLLVGLEGEDNLVEVPERVRQHPTELSAAMVSLMAALYRSGMSTPELGATPSSWPFPLARFSPFDWRPLAATFPSFCDPDAPAPDTVHSPSLDTPLLSLPKPSSDPNLELQRLEVAKIYRSLAEELTELELSQLKDHPAFWANIFNALLMHAHLVYDPPKNSVDLAILLHKAAYIIGGVRFSCAGIFAAVLLPNSSIGWKSMAWLPRVGSVKASAALMAKYCVNKRDPRVVFGCAFGVASAPQLRLFHDSDWEEKVGVATGEYLQRTVSVQNKKVLVPRLFSAVRKEFGRTPSEQLAFLHSSLPEPQGTAVLRCAEQRILTGRAFEPQPVDWTFSYAFAP